MSSLTCETHIPSDMCSPTQKTHIRDMRFSTCETYSLSGVFSPTWETHIFSDMCFPIQETHVSLVTCVLLPGKHIALMIIMCSITQETHFTGLIFGGGRGTHVPSD